MLGLTVAAGVFGTGTVVANAFPQEFRERFEHRFGREGHRDYDRRDFDRRGYVSGYQGYGQQAGVEYIPPCPGEGYAWVAGYYQGEYWVSGAWVFQGRRDFDRDADRGYGYGRGFEFDHERHYDNDRRYEDDRNRGYGEHRDDRRENQGWGQGRVNDQRNREGWNQQRGGHDRFGGDHHDNH